MALDTIILHGMEDIIIHDLLHGGMAYIGIHIADGVFRLDMDMVGSAGAFIHIDVEGGGQGDIAEDIGADTIEDTEEVEIPGTERVIEQGNAILPKMYIETDLTV